ncbi:hypothetical protein H696_02277 [Fonticula alba]|uniref:DH domain-containing protein n=1 Tax=Fonticula alba TaxID=691883 RepID=A0A058ZD16_FONAL|nr:hypothetical protein H696_02277 [Fonticula alba]KCV71332.1 hypothetical protein H696_02277 [Fonticula alba]|eukprot:XP_009494455.1 hypothetical protein H696_02277 [Fonticula alba]
MSVLFETRARWGFEPERPTELRLNAGDVVYVLDASTGGEWWKGLVADPKRPGIPESLDNLDQPIGWFPSTYVDLKPAQRAAEANPELGIVLPPPVPDDDASSIASSEHTAQAGEGTADPPESAVLAVKLKPVAPATSAAAAPASSEPAALVKALTPAAARDVPAATAAAAAAAAAPSSSASDLPGLAVIAPTADASTADVPTADAPAADAPVADAPAIDAPAAGGVVIVPEDTSEPFLPPISSTQNRAWYTLYKHREGQKEQSFQSPGAAAAAACAAVSRDSTVLSKADLDKMSQSSVQTRRSIRHSVTAGGSLSAGSGAGLAVSLAGDGGSSGTAPPSRSNSNNHRATISGPIVGTPSSPSTPVMMMATQSQMPPPVVKWVNFAGPDIVAKVDDRGRKRQEAIFELIETESTYINDITFIVNQYLTPLRTRKIIPPKAITALFSNIEMLLPVNIELLRHLTERQSINPIVENVGDIFLHVADWLKMYNAYCSNHPYSLIEYERLKSRPFRAFCQEVKALPESRHMDLCSFLIKPVQRICKYPLLIREIIRHTPADHPDHPNLERAFQKIETVVTIVNEATRQAEGVHKMLYLRSRINKLADILTPTRRFIAEETIALLKAPPTDPPTGSGPVFDKRLYLFNDLALLIHVTGSSGIGASPSGDEQLRLLARVPLECASVVACPVSDQGLQLVHAAHAVYYIMFTRAPICARVLPEMIRLAEEEVERSAFEREAGFASLDDGEDETFDEDLVSEGGSDVVDLDQESNARAAAAAAAAAAAVAATSLVATAESPDAPGPAPVASPVLSTRTPSHSSVQSATSSFQTADAGSASDDVPEFLKVRSQLRRSVYSATGPDTAADMPTSGPPPLAANLTASTSSAEEPAPPPDATAAKATDRPAPPSIEATASTAAGTSPSSMSPSSSPSSPPPALASPRTQSGWWSSFKSMFNSSETIPTDEAAAAAADAKRAKKQEKLDKKSGKKRRSGVPAISDPLPAGAQTPVPATPTSAEAPAPGSGKAGDAPVAASDVGVKAEAASAATAAAPATRSSTAPVAVKSTGAPGPGDGLATGIGAMATMEPRAKPVGGPPADAAAAAAGRRPVSEMIAAVNRRASISESSGPAAGLQRNESYRRSMMASSGGTAGGVTAASSGGASRAAAGGTPAAAAATVSDKTITSLVATVAEGDMADNLDTYILSVNVTHEDGSKNTLSVNKLYRDFYALHVALVTSFPSEAGRVSSSRTGRTLPDLPTRPATLIDSQESFSDVIGPRTRKPSMIGGDGAAGSDGAAARPAITHHQRLAHRRLARDLNRYMQVVLGHPATVSLSAPVRTFLLTQSGAVTPGGVGRAGASAAVGASSAVATAASRAPSSPLDDGAPQRPRASSPPAEVASVVAPGSIRSNPFFAADRR